LAVEARRAELLAVLAELGAKLTLARLDDLLQGKYGEDLGALTVGLLRESTQRRSLLPDRGESIEDAVMRVFKGQPGRRLSSGFFTRHMGLRRWTAQALLADLAERGLLEREGRTSATCYRLPAADETELEESGRGVN
jgi:hypothetical protein